MGVALLFLAIWGATRPPARQRRNTFWLMPQGDERDVTGPYTVAQIVAMWRAGQITTHGLVAEEGTEEWMPVMAWAKAFDASLNDSRPVSPLRQWGPALLLLGFLLLLFIPALGLLLLLIGLVLWLVGLS